MSLIVQKYGGSSLSSPARLRSVANHIAAARQQVQGVAVVVSAMGRTTDRLSTLARGVAPTVSGTGRREIDQLLATGEQVSASLLALALVELGVPALSLTGEQAGIETDGRYGTARIRAIRIGRVRDAIEAGSVPVVAGFQGVGPLGDISTLGRGGSDTTAVALSVALGAARCDIFTDVPGIFTADPRVVPAAWCHTRLSHPEAVLMTRAGAVVLHPRAADLAAEHRLPVRILSSATPAARPGTLITGDSPVEHPRILGVAASEAVVRVTARLTNRRQITTAQLLRSLSAAGIEIHAVRQQLHGDGGCTVTMALSPSEADEAGAILDRLMESGAKVERSRPSARLQLLGTGLGARGSIVGETVQLLANLDIAADSVEMTDAGLALDICPSSVPRAMRALHERWLETPTSASSATEAARPRGPLATNMTRRRA